MTPARAVLALYPPSWRARYGDEVLAYLDDSVIPVVEPTGLLTPEEFQKLDRASTLAASQRESEAAVQA